MAPPETTDRPYGLNRPTMADAKEAMYRVHGHTGRSTWLRLLSAAGLTGDETGEPALTRLIEAMERLDPISRLCAHALSIRLATHTYLTAAHAITRSPT